MFLTLIPCSFPKVIIVEVELTSRAAVDSYLRFTALLWDRCRFVFVAYSSAIPVVQTRGNRSSLIVI
jgi:hypothetical protein